MRRLTRSTRITGKRIREETSGNGTRQFDLNELPIEDDLTTLQTSKHLSNVTFDGSHNVVGENILHPNQGVELLSSTPQHFQSTVEDDMTTLPTSNYSSNVTIDVSNRVVGEIILHSNEEYLDIGDSTFSCQFCNAHFWYDERAQKSYNARCPQFSLCCMQGKIQLPLLKPPPQILVDLLFNNDDRSKHFLQNIRSYNNMFSFTSLGGKIDRRYNIGNSPPVFTLHGQNYHFMGSLLPLDGAFPKFSQLYIYDTDNEISNRINAVRCGEDKHSLHESIVIDLKSMLDEHNVLVKCFRMARDKLDDSDSINIKLRLIGQRDTDGRRYNLPTVSEVAGLIVGDFDMDMGDRDILIETRSGLLQRINELHPSYLPLQYPLLFPYVEDGYRDDVQFVENKTRSRVRRHVSVREFFAFRIQVRTCEPSSLISSRRLFQQFVVDGYTMVESSRLKYIKNNQTQLRADLYSGLADAVLRGESDATKCGKRIILPSSFTGGARYMIQNYQDSMAICKWAGYPDLFITFTCNPKWPEITRFLNRVGLNAEDRPDIISRIFKVKLDALIKDLCNNEVFGKVVAVVYTVEFQKRGLPHAHILLFLSAANKYPSSDDIDNIISAEIPDSAIDPHYFAAVRDFMIHGPCGAIRRNSPCMANGRCTKHFPKRFIDRTIIDDDGYPVYRRRDNGRTIMKSGETVDNRFVVPHNRHLLLRYGAHINVEWCNQSRSIKYLFKYVNKGHDRVTASFYQNSNDDGSGKQIDEVKMYYDCRYLSPCEAMWRIFTFEIQYKEPPVERLGFHLENQQNVVFDESDSLRTVISRQTGKQSMFLAWMAANKKYDEAKNITYAEFPTKFVWDSSIREWKERKQRFSIGRMFFVPPGSGEMYYLRCLLNKVKGPTSFEDIRCINGTQYSTYRDACYALGLLDDDKEYIDAIFEASHWASAKSLRHLFTTLLSSSALIKPEVVWDKCWHLMSDDILYQRRRLVGDQELELNETQIHTYTLVEIEMLLQSFGKQLSDFPPMPVPDPGLRYRTYNALIHEELCYDQQILIEEHANLLCKMNIEQKHVYDSIMEAVKSNIGGVFFIYGYGGTGKTYIWRTLSAALRSKGEIVLNVASSGIASLLLPGGRTAHSRFAIPIQIHEDSTCNIKQGTPLAELINKCSIIIWDEAPMLHRYCFEALDKTMRDIVRFSNNFNQDKPFGGKTVVFGGDFRQILPVIPKGSRQDIVRATINSSYLWHECKVFTLTKNMRLECASSTKERDDLLNFSKWIASIGDGTIGSGNDGFSIVDIPNDLLIKSTGDPLNDIVHSTYPSFNGSMTDPNYFKGRCILAPTNDVVDLVNDYMLSLCEAKEKTYLSSDSSCRSDSNIDLLHDLQTPEFLNTLRCSGVPTHALRLKVGTPVMLIRNIDHKSGLCNGTRLVITRLGNHVLEAKMLDGRRSGDKVLIPRLSLTTSDSRMPFRFNRRQFPLIISYAMTINKSQGQSMSHVGLLLKKPVFSHGQLYVAVSRVTHRNGLKILIYDNDGKESTSTTNVVFKEVFQNI